MKIPNSMMQVKFAIVVGLLTYTGAGFSQQLADDGYNPPIANPMYPAGKGPIIRIDEGHHNFHTLAGRYQSFASLLRRDGYVLEAHEGEFRQESLKETDLLVISNALNKRNEKDWSLPTPSAFSASEIDLLEHWVSEGGRLFLIADHMPFPGSAADLAAAFGFEFENGYAFDTTAARTSTGDGLAHFTRENGGLQDCPITRGRNQTERITKAVTFTGQAFKIPKEAQSLLTFDERFLQLLPEVAWEFTADTPRLQVAGWSQGAYRTYGKGKVVVFGEAAMFSAQRKGPDKVPMGMNAPFAAENHQLLLNIIHWLDDQLD